MRTAVAAIAFVFAVTACKKGDDDGKKKEKDDNTTPAADVDPDRPKRPAKAIPDRPGRTIPVKTVDELVAALADAADAPGTRIVVAPGTYDLEKASHADELYGDKVKWEADGEEQFLVLEKMRNVTLSGAKGGDEARIVIANNWVPVVEIRDAEDFVVENITFGHVPQSNSPCLAPTLRVKFSKEVHLVDTKLFGSGTHGLILDGVEDFVMEGGEVYECTQGYANISDSVKVHFVETTFRDTTGRGFYVFASEGVRLNGCEITGTTVGRSTNNSLLFGADDSIIEVIDTNIHDNELTYFSTRDANLELVRTEVDMEQFVEGETP